MHASAPPASTASASPRRIELRRLADRVRAGRAGGHGRVVRAAEPERDRELPARRVEEHARDEGRRHAVEAALAEDVVLLHHPEEAADRRAEEDADAVGLVRAVEPRVRDRLAAGAEREQDVALELPHLLRRGDGARRRSPSPRRRSARGTRSRRRRGSSRRRSRRRRAARQVARASFPIGVTAPSPVTTTLVT